MSPARIRNTARILMPAPAKPVAKAIRDTIDPVVVHRYRSRTGETRPIPPAALRARIGAPGIGWFFESAKMSTADLQHALRVAGRSLDGVASLLDFGCGCGRVLQEIAHRIEDPPPLHGCDVDSEAIAWAQENYPGLRLVTNGPEPPLPFEDDSFELIYSSSVFTHLDEGPQDAWLAELARVVRPGGVLLLSVHGEHALADFNARRSAGNSLDFQRRLTRHAPLAAEGFIYEPYSRSIWNERDFIGKGQSYGVSFHSETYIRDRWSEHGTVLAILPRALLSFQDLVVLTR